MGYDSRLYVVNKFSDDFQGREIIAQFELCVVHSDIRELLTHTGVESGCYLWTEFREGESYEDCYGDKLKEMSLDEAIKILQKAVALDDYYRRYQPCLSMLQGFKLEESHFDSLRVIHFGH